MEDKTERHRWKSKKDRLEKVLFWLRILYSPVMMISICIYVKGGELEQDRQKRYLGKVLKILSFPSLWIGAKVLRYKLGD